MSDFKAKMHQIRFWLGSAPDRTGGAYSAPPDLLAGFKGPTSKGREGREVEEIGWKGIRGREGVGRAIQFLASGRHRLSYATGLICSSSSKCSLTTHTVTVHSYTCQKDCHAMHVVCNFSNLDKMRQFAYTYLCSYFLIMIDSKYTVIHIKMKSVQLCHIIDLYDNVLKQTHSVKNI